MPHHEHTWCPVNFAQPEHLKVNTSIPAIIVDPIKGEYIINRNYDLTSNNIMEVSEEAKRRFADGLEGSDTKQYNPEIYQKLLSYMGTSKTL